MSYSPGLESDSISAIVLSYNKGWIFDRFLASLRRQTRNPDEVIIVDDASTDGMKERLEGLRGECRIIRLEKNLGQSVARNVGFEKAKGMYCIFLDGDVEMAPDMLEVMHDTLKRTPHASIAYSHYYRRGSRNDHIQSRAWDSAFLRRGNFISTMSMVRTTDLPRPPFDSELRRLEDWDLWLTMAHSGHVGVLINRFLFSAHYRTIDLSGTGESDYWFRRVAQKHNL